MAKPNDNEPRLRKVVKPFEGAELPRVNKTKQKTRQEPIKPISLRIKKAPAKPKPKSKTSTKMTKPSKKDQLSTILYLLK